MLPPLGGSVSQTGSELALPPLEIRVACVNKNALETLDSLRMQCGNTEKNKEHGDTQNLVIRNTPLVQHLLGAQIGDEWPEIAFG